MPFHLRDRVRAGFWALGLLALASLVPVDAHAQPGAAPSEAPVEEARTRFSRGVELYKEGDFRAAIIEFNRAYEVAPNFRVLFNIGQAQQELQNYAAALDAFERYLKDGGGEVPPDRAEHVRGEIQKLVGRVASITVKVNVSGATLRVDDVNVGTTPIAARIRISAGRRKISVSKSGYQSVTQDLDSPA
jgi:tetratricopeptide (TPR) repeat protein